MTTVLFACCWIDFVLFFPWESMVELEFGAVARRCLCRTLGGCFLLGEVGTCGAVIMINSCGISWLNHELAARTVLWLFFLGENARGAEVNSGKSTDDQPF